MIRSPWTHALESALIAEGLVPKNCRLLDVVIPAGELPILRYEVFIAVQDLKRLAAAFAVAAGPTEPTEPLT